MALVVNSNIASLNAQRQLLQSGADLDQASERLASGRRINSAADDAAGLAISNRQTSQIRGLDQAVRNANDGISLIQTAEGALDEVTNILQRMRELAIQSSNGIYSDTDRATLDAEVQQLKAEVDRIAETTAFNGQNVLDGSLGNVALQVGSEANQTIDFEVAGFSTSSLGGSGGDIVGEATAAGLTSLRAVTGTASLQINDILLTELTTTNADTVNNALATINADLASKGAEVDTLVTVEATAVGDGVLNASAGESFDLAVTDGDGEVTTYVITDTNSLSELVDKINSDTAVSASINDSGKLVLSAAGVTSIQTTDDTTADASGITDATVSFSLVFNDTSASNQGIKLEAGTGVTNAELDAVGINLTDDDYNLLATALTTVATSDINAGDLIINGVEIGQITSGTTRAANIDAVVEAINLLAEETGVVAFEAATTAGQVGLRSTDGSQISIKYGDNATADDVEALTGFQEQNAVSGSGSIAGVSVGSISAAQSSIEVIDSALETINDTRSELGAINNRLDFTVSNLTNISEKTSAARSQITDADFAAETAQLSRAQVLQQASQAILAQANARPQQVLSLLQ